MPSFGERLKNVWNAFTGRDPTPNSGFYYGYSSRPDRHISPIASKKSIVATIRNRIAVDCSSININHVRTDEDGKYLNTINDSLNKALSRSANEDQTGRELIQDAVMSMLEDGCVAIIPTRTFENPYSTDSYKILELRTGRITEWFPKKVRVEVFNEDIGEKQIITVNKSYCAIIENPFYSIMNEPNSTLQRLIRVLNQIDRLNDENSSGKMNLIVQLPYVIKTPAKQALAEERRKDIEAQLTSSKYGIAYADGTEKIVQLNRPIENNLWEQATDLKNELFSQMGLSKEIFDGTADEATLLNYYNRTIEPILNSLVEEMDRKWISKTASSQGQAIRYYRDPFKLVPITQLAEIVDKFTRNEIMSSNEFRSILGLKPSDDPKADKLINSNLNHPEETEESEIDSEIQNE